MPGWLGQKWQLYLQLNLSGGSETLMFRMPLSLRTAFLIRRRCSTGWGDNAPALTISRYTMPSSRLLGTSLYLRDIALLILPYQETSPDGISELQTSRRMLRRMGRLRSRAAWCAEKVSSMEEFIVKCEKESRILQLSCNFFNFLFLHGNNS